METALSDLRASALAAPGGVDTELLREVDAALGTSTLGSSTLPASLIGLVAQRGHAALLTQLLQFSTTSAEPSRKNSDSALLDADVASHGVPDAVVYSVLALNVALTLLQFHWASLIGKAAHKMLIGDKSGRANEAKRK